MIESSIAVHRIGGSKPENLELKATELTLEPQGFSVLLGGVAQSAADQMRRAFADPVQFDRLRKLSEVVASSTAGEIRAVGFDVVLAPTSRFPNHGRVVHLDGPKAFAGDNLEQLRTVFRETKTPGD